jgi:hypothetical protein
MLLTLYHWCLPHPLYSTDEHALLLLTIAHLHMLYSSHRFPFLPFVYLRNPHLALNILPRCYHFLKAFLDLISATPLNLSFFSLSYFCILLILQPLHLIHPIISSLSLSGNTGPYSCQVCFSPEQTLRPFITCLPCLKDWVKMTK